MELHLLLQALSDPAAYPHPAGAIEVVQTHISAVFLAGGRAYKLRKPVVTGYLDFSTPEKRHEDCEREVRLNRRLAAHVYLGVVPVTLEAGRVKVAGEGPVIDWLVEMERLPASATLRSRLSRDEVSAVNLQSLARRLASFHASSARAPAGSPFGTFARVSADVRATLPAEADDTVSAVLLGRLQEAVEQNLGRLRPLIETRSRAGVVRDTHGDVRLDHVYLFPDRPEPEDVVLIDCIEFNDNFRLADPIADMAFLIMELLEAGRPELAATFRDAYQDASGDGEGSELVPFYTGYRAAVRAEVEGMRAHDPEVPEAERLGSRDRARGLWLLALGQLDEAERRPCLILTAGLPGSGKSTLARSLAGAANLHVIRSDVVRKELAGPDTSEDLYTPQWNERTYLECHRRAEEALHEGGRVLIDANYREEKHRLAALDLARHWGAPILILLCRASPETVRARLTARSNDASDADWAVYQRTARTWQEFGEVTRRAVRELAEGTAEAVLRQGLEEMRQAGLLAREEPGS